MPTGTNHCHQISDESTSKLEAISQKKKKKNERDKVYVFAKKVGFSRLPTHGACQLV